MQTALRRHQNTFLTLKQTAVDRRFAMGFRKTYPYPRFYLNDGHRRLVARVRRDRMIERGVEGWLLPADALKLYELAYFCGGDILELGTYRGLSASVLLEASVAAGLANEIISIDLDPGATQAGRVAMAGRPGAERVWFFATSADEALGTFTRARRLFRFCFIDHSHAYSHVRSACALLPGVLEPGSFCLFHDYNDRRNAMADVPDYGVYQGVADGLDPECFEFWGIYGCCGLFRYLGARVGSPSKAPWADAASRAI